MNKQTPARSNVVVLKQLLNLIPRGMVSGLARQTGVEAKARTFSVMSHLCAMLFAQLSHAIGLNDVCDSLRLKAAALSRFGITPPSRNTLSHANKVREADFIEKLFWSVLGHLQTASPSFASGRKGKGLLRRFKVKVHAVDSNVIQLVANLDWAKHRRRKPTIIPAPPTATGSSWSAGASSRAAVELRHPVGHVLDHRLALGGVDRAVAVAVHPVEAILHRA